MNGSPSRLVLLLELAEEAPAAAEIAGYLADPDPGVRRTALNVLSETAGEWDEASPVFAAALADTDAEVRRTAAGLLRELRDVLVPGAEFERSLRAAARLGDPAVRAAAVGALWRHRLCGTAELAAWLGDPDEGVRREVIAAFGESGDLDALAKAAADPSPAIRTAVATRIGAAADPRGTAALRTLAGDQDTGVRAAALGAMARTGCTGAAMRTAVRALADPAWQVREGAAKALSAAGPGAAAVPLITATRDPNLDVRKAAVQALCPLASVRADVRAALEAARDDPDADVRAYARRGLSQRQSAES